MNFKIKNISILNFLNIIVAGIIIFLVIFFSKYNVIESDDAFNIFYERGCSLFECIFIKSYKAKLLSDFLIKIIGGELPLMLGIHPVIWIQTGGAFINGIFYALLSFFIAKGMFFYKKRNLFYPLTALIFYLWIQHYFFYQLAYEQYCAFYSFTFNMIFYCIFWQSFLKKYTEKKPAGLLFYLFAFFLGMTSEQSACATFISLFLILMIEVFKNKKLNTFVLKILICNFIGCIVYLSFPGFYFDIMAKFNAGILNYSQPYKLSEIYDALKTVFLSDFTLYIFLIVILLIITNKIYKEESERKYLLTILSMFIGGLIFYFLLILTKYESENFLYIKHFDVLVNIKILFSCIILLEIGLLLKKIDFSRKNKIIIFSILLIIFIAELLTILIQNPKRTNNEDYYKSRYLSERILAYYAYQNKKTVVYSDVLIFAINPYVRPLYQKDYDEDNIIFIDDLNKVYDIYLKNGGCPISEEEMNKADFQKLLNKKYVLECQ